MIALMMKDLIFFSAQMWTFYVLFVTLEQWRWVGAQGSTIWHHSGRGMSVHNGG
jgi:hypothetical protein